MSSFLESLFGLHGKTVLMTCVRVVAQSSPSLDPRASLAEPSTTNPLAHPSRQRWHPWYRCQPRPRSRQGWCGRHPHPALRYVVVVVVRELARGDGDRADRLPPALRTEENTTTRDAIIALGRQARIYVCDLADKAQVKKVVPTITGELGLKVDILINCGGIQRRHKSEVFPDEDWEEVLQVNLSTCFTLARCVSQTFRS
jgi:hypothetical protein